MSQIGFIKQEQMAVRREGKEEIVKWLECHFRVAGLRPFSAKMTANTKKQESGNQPDYYLYLRANINKGDKFRDIRIGALWLKKKMFDGVEKTFMTGNISIAFGEIPITVWKAEARYEGEKIEYLYDISTMKESSPQAQPAGYDVTYEESGDDQPRITDEDGEPIPF